MKRKEGRERSGSLALGRVVTTGAAIALCLVATPLAAQTEGGLRPDEQLRTPRLPGEPPPDLFEIPRADERDDNLFLDTLIPVTSFRLEGVQDHPDQGVLISEMQALLDQSLEEQPDGFYFEDLEDVADLVTNYYRGRGLLLATAYLPAQDVVGGVVTIRVLEGSLGSVRFNRVSEGRYRYSDEILRVPFRGLEGEIVEKESAESALLLLRDYPGVADASGIFRPGDRLGETELVVDLQPERFYEHSMTLDNHGTPNTGDWRFIYSGLVNNPLKRGDALDFLVYKTFKPAEGLFGGVNYRIPVFDARTTLGAGYSLNTYDLGGTFAGLDFSGEAEIAQVYLQRRFIVRRLANLTGHVGFSVKRGTTEQSDVETSKDRLSVLDLTGLFDSFDRFNGVNSGVVQLNFGIPEVFGAQSSKANGARPRSPPSNPPPSRFGESGKFATGEFFKVFGAYTRLQRLPFEGHEIRFRAQGQWSDDRLSPLEQFLVGGPQSVRAYPRAERLADYGLFLSGEYIWTVPGFTEKFESAFGGPLGSPQLKLSAYIDWARGLLNDPIETGAAVQEQAVTLKGFGFGAQIVSAGSWHARAELAFPFGSRGTSNPAEDNFDSRFLFDLSYQFK